MQLTGNEDLRVQKTITNIHDSFRKLICEMDYEKITVTMLCKVAMINKKTFYTYYETLDHLLAELQSEYVSLYLPFIQGLEIPKDIDKLIRTFFEFSVKQDEAYEKITCASSYSSIRQNMINSVMETPWNQSSFAKECTPFVQDIILNFWNGNVIEIYIRWVASGKQIPLEEIISITTHLISQGIYGFTAKYLPM